VIRSIVATWVLAHRGPEALAGATLATLLIAAIGWQPLDLLRDAQPPPLWAVYPGMIALIATTVGRNRLAALTAATPRGLVAPRAAWLLAATLGAGLLALVVQSALGQRGIWVFCTGLTAITLGLGAVWRPLGLIVAAGVELWAVTSAARAAFISADPPAQLFARLGAEGVTFWWVAVALCAAVYVWRGE